MLKKNTAYNYANRELSWLKFNERVLSQTSDSKIPLLERVRFLSIAFSNLDEFFMVRVAGLNVQKFSRNKSFDGLTPQQQLKLIDKETSKMISNIKSIWIDLLRELSENKIHIDVEKTLKTKDKTFIKNYLEKNGVKLKNLTFDYYNLLPKTGFFKSRFSYITIMLISLFPFLFFLKKNKPNYLIAHLLTSLPIIFTNFINPKTRLILRISGYPKLNFFRKNLWINSKKKLYRITCPTDELKKDLIENNIFDIEKIETLPDAIINIQDFRIKKIIDKDSSDIEINHNYFLAAGRFTKQKNFIYLIKEFKSFCLENPDEKLLIIGDGEEKDKMIEEIRKQNLSNNVFIINFTENIYYYMKKSKAFILSSLWEEVGFVIVEAALCNSFIISSNCKNGPKEFLSYGDAGLLYDSNISGKLSQKLKEFLKLDDKIIFKKKIKAKQNSLKYSLYRHFCRLLMILECD